MLSASSGGTGSPTQPNVHHLAKRKSKVAALRETQAAASQNANDLHWQRQQLLNKGATKAKGKKLSNTAARESRADAPRIDIGLDATASSANPMETSFTPLVRVEVESQYIAPANDTSHGDEDSDEWVDAALALEDYEYQSSIKSQVVKPQQNWNKLQAHDTTTPSPGRARNSRIGSGSRVRSVNL